MFTKKEETSPTPTPPVTHPHNVSGGIIVGAKGRSSRDKGNAKKFIDLQVEGTAKMKQLASGNIHYRMKVENVYKDYMEERIQTLGTN